MMQASAGTSAEKTAGMRLLLDKVIEFHRARRTCCMECDSEGDDAVTTGRSTGTRLI